MTTGTLSKVAGKTGEDCLKDTFVILILPSFFAADCNWEYKPMLRRNSNSSQVHNVLGLGRENPVTFAGVSN